MGLRPLDEGAPARESADRDGVDRRVGDTGVRHRRGVLGGFVILAVGLAFLLQALRLPHAGPLLFVALGGAFGAAYYLGYRQYVYLVPAAILMGLGVGLLLPAVFEVGALAGPLFFGALAAGLVTVTLLAPERSWPLFIAIPLALLAVIGVIGRVDFLPAEVQAFILPAVLLAVGAFLLVEPSHR